MALGDLGRWDGDGSGWAAGSSSVEQLCGAVWLDEDGRDLSSPVIIIIILFFIFYPNEAVTQFD